MGSNGRKLTRYRIIYSRGKKIETKGYKTPALFSRVEFSPKKCLSTGAFVTHWQNLETDDKILSYGGNLFFVKNNIKFKTEYIGGVTEEGDYYSGLYLVGGYKLDKLEPVVRFDMYSPNGGDADSKGVKNYSNISLGLNFYYLKKVKFQGNYILRQEDGTELDNNLIYVNAQYSL